jgi:chemotaxis protein methyltransferase WspC
LQPSILKAQALADAGAPGEAIKMLDQLMQTSAVDAEAWQLLGSAYLARGARQEAEVCFRKVVYLQPEHAQALLQLSVFAEEREDRAAAERMRARAASALKGETP